MDEGCFAHPAKAKASNCFDCMRPICVACVKLHGSHDYCPECSATIGRKVLRRRVVLGVLAASVCLTLVLGYVLYGNPFRYGAETFAVLDLAAEVKKEPCDRAKVLALAETYVRVAAPRECLALTDKYFATCGDWPRLRWPRFTAFKRLSELDKAIAEATLLIDSEPYDFDYWWWRAQANEEAGKLEAAADDYRQALIIEPALTNIPFNLAAVHEKLGRPCDAIWPLEQFLSAHPEHLDNQRVRAQLERYYREPRCQAIRGTGKHTLRFAPGARVIIAEASINGVKGRFVIDTGATFVSLAPRFAKKIGADSAPAVTITMQTANGVSYGRLFHTEKVSLGGVTAHRVPAVIMKDGLGDIDGLLGMSFLSRFSVHIDHGAGAMTLSQR